MCFINMNYIKAGIGTLFLGNYFRNIWRRDVNIFIPCSPPFPFLEITPEEIIFPNVHSNSMKYLKFSCCCC